MVKKHLPDIVSPARGREGKRVLLVVVPSIVIALCLMMIFREAFPRGLMEEDIGVWAAYFTVLGVIYAVITGFIFLRVMNRFNENERVVQDGVNAITNICDFLSYIDENQETKKNIKQCLMLYVRDVWQAEWETMIYNKTYKPERYIGRVFSPQINRLIEAVDQMEVMNASDLLALHAIMGKISELEVCRARRLNLAGQHLAPILRILILFLSVTLVAGAVLANIESVLIHALLVSSVMGAVVLVYIVIRDMDRPFQGYWRIEVSPYKDIIDGLQEELEESESSSAGLEQ